MSELPVCCKRKSYEPSKSYKLFKIYLELGIYRTLNNVAETSGLSLRNIKRLSSTWSWVYRSNKFDERKLEQNSIELKKSIDNGVIVQFEQKMKLTGLSQILITSLIDYFG